MTYKEFLNRTPRATIEYVEKVNAMAENQQERKAMFDIARYALDPDYKKLIDRNAIKFRDLIMFATHCVTRDGKPIKGVKEMIISSTMKADKNDNSDNPDDPNSPVNTGNTGNDDNGGRPPRMIDHGQLPYIRKENSDEKEER